jgi:hypothetical protein
VQKLLKEGAHLVVKEYAQKEFPDRELDPTKNSYQLENIGELLFTSSRDKLSKGWKKLAKDKFYSTKIKDE